MELHLKIVGVCFVLLSFLHIIFPKRFHWKEELRSLSLINRQIFYIHTFFIALIILLMGVLCFSSSAELTETILGKRVSLGFAIFWTARLLIQFFGYSSELWKGKPFETTIHIIFSIFWIYVSAVFWRIYWS